MKKRIIIIACSLLVGCGVALLAKVQNNKDRLFGLSIEALANDEAGISGNCKNTESSPCTWACPKCGALYEAKGNLGPSYGMQGICERCGK